MLNFHIFPSNGNMIFPTIVEIRYLQTLKLRKFIFPRINKNVNTNYFFIVENV